MTTDKENIQYAIRLIEDWWKPQTTSQAVHREYALSALAEAAKVCECGLPADSVTEDGVRLCKSCYAEVPHDSSA